MAVKTYVTIDVQAEYMAAHLFGELDHHSVQSIREEIDRMAEQNEPTELILDFGGVTFMDSSGIGLIIGRADVAESIGCRVHIGGLSGAQKKLVKLSGVEKLKNLTID
jgi:stage II sporulation protein AA (anti-sigma F factor antagonist)